jgi:hypothetical protein
MPAPDGDRLRGQPFTLQSLCASERFRHEAAHYPVRLTKRVHYDAMNPDEPVADNTSGPCHKTHSANANDGDGIQSLGCVLFGVAAIAFGSLSVFLLTWGMAWSLGSRERDSITAFVICGAIYIIGSLICFRVRRSGSAMLLPGIILNAVGAYVWVPGMAYLNRGGWVVVMAGLALMGCWIALIFRQPTAPKCKSPDAPDSTN